MLFQLIEILQKIIKRRMFFLNQIYTYLGGCWISPPVPLTLITERSNTADLLVLKAPWAESWWLAVSASLFCPPPRAHPPLILIWDPLWSSAVPDSSGFTLCPSSQGWSIAGSCCYQTLWQWKVKWKRAPLSACMIAGSVALDKQHTGKNIGDSFLWGTRWSVTWLISPE